MSKLMQYIINWFGKDCFLLKDLFTGNIAAPLTSPRICTHVGQLILDQTDGQFYITAGRFIFPAQGTPAWGDQDWHALKNDGDQYEVLSGKKLILKFRGMWTDAGQTDCWLGWGLDVTPDTIANAEHTFYRSGGPASAIICTSGASDNALTLRDLWAGGGDWFQTAIALRPYTVGGLHWYPSAPGVFAHGAHFYWRDESDADSWLLAWYRQLQSRTDPIYPAFSNYDSEGDLDYVLIPCDDEDIWNPLFTPIAYDEFTDTNGVLLPNHTMNYGGYTWVNAVGVWDINTNQADPDATANAITYTAITKCDVWLEADAYIAVDSQGVGLVARKSADTAGGANEWFAVIASGIAGDDTWLYEVNNGVQTERASADNDFTAETTYNLRLRCDGTQLTFYVDYVEELHYATGWFNRHATWHGMIADNHDGARFNNFIILPRGTGLIRIAFDSFTDPNATSLDAHTMDEGGLTWVEDVGDFSINGNEAAEVATADAHAHAVTEVSNMWLTVRVLVSAVASKFLGICFRKSVDTVGGYNMWEYTIGNAAGVDTFLREHDNGVVTTRAQADTDVWAVATRYYLQVHAEGQTINCYGDGTLRLTYALATCNETATWHGIYQRNPKGDTRWDQFRVTEDPALGEYDTVLNSIQ